jgi:hypothetical protein
MDAGSTFHFSEHFYQNSMAPLANLSGMGHSTTSQTTYHTWMSQDFALRHQFSVVRCPVHPFFNGLRVAWPIIHLYSQCSAHFNAVRIGTFSPEATRILGSTRVHPGHPGSTRVHPFVDVFFPMNQGSSIHGGWASNTGIAGLRSRGFSRAAGFAGRIKTMAPFLPGRACWSLCDGENMWKQYG